MPAKSQSTNLPPAHEPPTAHTSAPGSQAPPVDPPSMEVDEPAASQTAGTNVPASTTQPQGPASNSVAPAPSLPPPIPATSGLWGWEVGAYAVMHPTTMCEICRAYLAHTDVGDATFAAAMRARRHHEEHLASNGRAVLIARCETIERQFAECADDLVHEEKRGRRYKTERDDARADLATTRRSLDRATAENTRLMGLLRAYETAPPPVAAPAPPSRASTSSSARAPHAASKKRPSQKAPAAPPAATSASAPAPSARLDDTDVEMPGGSPPLGNYYEDFSSSDGIDSEAELKRRKRNDARALRKDRSGHWKAFDRQREEESMAAALTDMSRRFPDTTAPAPPAQPLPGFTMPQYVGSQASMYASATLAAQREQVRRSRPGRVASTALAPSSTTSQPLPASNPTAPRPPPAPSPGVPTTASRAPKRKRATAPVDWATFPIRNMHEARRIIAASDTSAAAHSRVRAEVSRANLVPAAERPEWQVGLLRVWTQHGTTKCKRQVRAEAEAASAAAPDPYASAFAPPPGGAQPVPSVHEWQMPQAAGHYAPTSAPEPTRPRRTVSSSQGGGSAASSSRNTAAAERTYPGIAPDPRFHDDMRLTHNDMTVPEMVEHWREHPQQAPDGVGGYSGQITLRRGEAWILASNSGPPRSPDNDQRAWWNREITNLFSVPGWFNQIARRSHARRSNTINAILYARDTRNVTPEQVVEHLLHNGITDNMVMLLEEISRVRRNRILRRADDDMSDWPCEPTAQTMIESSAPDNTPSGPPPIHEESAIADSHMIVDRDDLTNSARATHRSRSGSRSPTNSASSVEDLYKPTKRAAKDLDGDKEPDSDAIASSATEDTKCDPPKSPPLPPLPDEDDDDLMQGPE